MSDTPIEQMDYKQLRKEVQRIRDDLAIFKRKYEDILYNLDFENFGAHILKERQDMKTEIKVTAEGVSSKVSKAEAMSLIQQSAAKITAKVEDIEENVGTLSSEIEMTPDRIAMAVNAAFSHPEEVENFEESVADKVEVYYETSTGLYWYHNGEDWVSSIKANFGSIFSQTTDGFTLDGKRATFTGVIYLTDNEGNPKFAITHDESQEYPMVTIRGIGGTRYPILIGDSANNVYIGVDANDYKVATQGWVESAANVVARFG